MIQAIVYACLMSNPTYCIMLEDQRGPYESERVCKSRALQMAEDVHIHMKGYKPRSWECRTLPAGMLTK